MNPEHIWIYAHWQELREWHLEEKPERERFARTCPLAIWLEEQAAERRRERLQRLYATGQASA